MSGFTQPAITQLIADLKYLGVFIREDVRGLKPFTDDNAKAAFSSRFISQYIAGQMLNDCFHSQ